MDIALVLSDLEFTYLLFEEPRLFSGRPP